MENCYSYGFFFVKNFIYGELLELLFGLYYLFVIIKQNLIKLATIELK